MENKLTKVTPVTFADIKEKFIQVVDEATFAKEVSFACQILGRNEYLAGCEKQSILEAVLNVAQVGLTLNPASKMAYLVPRMVSGKRMCCLEPSYMGLCKLATDTGSIKNIYAHLVYEGEAFEYTLGTAPSISHKPSLGLRDNPVAVYAVAVLSDNRTQVEVMDVSEVDAIRETSESYKSFKAGKTKSCIWETYYGEMARKTVIKRLFKYLPKSEVWDKLYQAVELDNEDYKPTYEQLDYIDRLLETCTLSDARREFIAKHMNTYTAQQCADTIQLLKDNQRNPIESGANYNAGEIHKHLDNIEADDKK